jgi:hypothetical protein
MKLGTSRSLDGPVSVFVGSLPLSLTRDENSRMNGATSSSSGVSTIQKVLVFFGCGYFIPSILPSFRWRPDRVVGIPVLRAIADLKRVIPRNRFHENVSPGPSFTRSPSAHVLPAHGTSPATFGRLVRMQPTDRCPRDGTLDLPFTATQVGQNTVAHCNF